MCLCCFVLTANREADAGFLLCPGCAFENFTRFAYCCLCGEKLPAATNERANRSKKKTRGQQAADAIQGTTAVLITVASKALTATQLRVR